MITVSRSVNFGASKTGLATVGYSLVNPDGTELVARVITGVVEAKAGTGIYLAEIFIPDTWSGLILWDTGKATPRYASENIDYRQFTAQSQSNAGGYAVMSQPIAQVFTTSDKKKLFKALAQIMERLQITNVDLAEKVGAVAKTVHAMLTEKQFTDYTLDLKTQIGALKEAIANDTETVETLVEAVSVMAENQEIKDLLQEVGDHVEAQLAQAES